jgi:outer membrane protein OmpA-like peptidoglycan-associated protein
MVNIAKSLGLTTLVLGGAMGATAFAQSAAPGQSTAPSATQSTPSSPSATADPNDSTTYATGKPLEGQSKEGFWGHMNPFARKKWVQREVDPIKDRTNELDQLQAKNANDIKDVDGRAQAGISKAMMAANTADQHASDASNRANAAQSTATTATTRTDALKGTVSNLDQYQQVTSVDVKFAAGRTTLGPQGKADLDTLGSKLASEKGYIIEIQGYSKGGVQSSQAMADSVARYLVTEQQVPLYRIYRTGLGKNQAQAADKSQTQTATADAATTATADTQAPIVNGVRVTLLHNSLASLSGPDATTSSPSATPSTNGQSMPPSTNQ